MAILLNSLFIVFKMSLLHNYRITYYDYIVKSCCVMSCNPCISLDVALMLATRKWINVDSVDQEQWMYLCEHGPTGYMAMHYHGFGYTLMGEHIVFT